MPPVVVDAQVHLWAPDEPAHPWPAERRSLASGHRASYGAADLLPEMDRAGVHGAVVIPASFAGWRNDVVADAAVRHPDRLAAMAILPLDEAGGRAVVEAVDPRHGIHGVRVTGYLEPGRTQLVEGVADWLWPLAQRLDVPVMVNAPGILDTVADVARRHPELRLAVDHCGVHSHDRDQPLPERVLPVLQLAAYENVSVKTSALVLQSHAPYPFRDLHESIERVVEAFGPRRVMWGTDLTRLDVDYRRLVTMYTEELPFLDGTATEWIMGRSLTTWLRWDGPQGAADAAADVRD